MTTHKIAIIQARMSSSRLPGKVLIEINERPMLQHVIERGMRAKHIDDIVVATTSDASDDVLEIYCQSKGIPCYRGSPSNVLDRYYQASRQFNADIIIRLTADCPLIDPTLIDLTVTAFCGDPFAAGLDYNRTSLLSPGDKTLDALDFCANRLPPPWKRTVPIGLDVEVCSMAALENAWQHADQLYQREHVMPYIYEGVAFSHHDQKTEWQVDTGETGRGFKVGLLNHHPDYGSMRWTVDTADDLEFIRQVYSHFGSYEIFGWKQVLDLLWDHPELAAINAGVQHKTAYDVDERASPA